MGTRVGQEVDPRRRVIVRVEVHDVHYEVGLRPCRRITRVVATHGCDRRASLNQESGPKIRVWFVATPNSWITKRLVNRVNYSAGRERLRSVSTAQIFQDRNSPY